MKFSGETVAVLARAIGIDAAEVARRKAFLGLDEADVRLLTQLQMRLQDAQRQFIVDFYAHLLTFEETRHFIWDARSPDRLRRTQAAYFESLTAGDYVPEYVLHRLRVGITHQHIGLAPQAVPRLLNKIPPLTTHITFEGKTTENNTSE